MCSVIVCGLYQERPGSIHAHTVCTVLTTVASAITCDTHIQIYTAIVAVLHMYSVQCRTTVQVLTTLLPNHYYTTTTNTY